MSKAPPPKEAELGKTREEILAGRKAKKAEKANKKTGKPAQATTTQIEAPKKQVAKVHEKTPLKVTSAPSRVKEASRPPQCDRSSPKEDKNFADNRKVHFDLNTKVAPAESDESLVAALAHTEYSGDLVLLNIHPGFITLFTKCERGEIYDIDDLCKSFLGALREYVRCWGMERNASETSPTLAHELEISLRTQLDYLTKNGRWPLPFALGNIVRLFKKYLRKIEEQESTSRSNSEERITYNDLLECVLDWLDDTECNFFKKAVDKIIFYTTEKLEITKKVLVFDWCHLVNDVLVAACGGANRQLQEIVVIDQETNGRGVRHFDTLLEKRIRLSYGDLRSLSAALEGCSMALVGCSAVLSNGSVAVPKGTMLIALACEAACVPVVVVTQTFKFFDKVLSHGNVSLMGREDIEIVPCQLAPMIITEIGPVPSTSAPAILRAKSLESND